jgi:hypothetical protein
MVIISTRAVAVSIQAVLPVSRTGAGAAGTASCANAAVPVAQLASKPARTARAVGFEREERAIDFSIGMPSPGGVVAERVLSRESSFVPVAEEAAKPL